MDYLCYLEHILHFMKQQLYFRPLELSEYLTLQIDMAHTSIVLFECK